MCGALNCSLFNHLVGAREHAGEPAAGRVLASVVRQEYQCEPSGGCVSEPSTTTLQCRSLCWTWKSKRNWIGSRKTDVTAHRQDTCATTERRLCLRRLKGSTSLTYPR